MIPNFVFSEKSPRAIVKHKCTRSCLFEILVEQDKIQNPKSNQRLSFPLTSTGQHSKLQFFWDICYVLDNSRLSSSLELSPVCSQSTFHTCYSFVSPLQVFFFFFFFCHAMWLMGSYFPNQGLNLGSQQWEHRVLLTGPSANSPCVSFT